ncbi:D-arabitol-phosphate dehydrogenase [Moorella thermoacetica]|uniref:D-arabitol-phosphate dehydrogenase n=1 Tax=Neomoorella thermoacetica TaxID=1525 RepID=A0AAC9HFJ3_NEOTH|nr:D-arabitol-phosphate dehydrogenase [Moorella thermoacetica]TYL10557.1 D-arabitol-phosphate dehydrogenase [Moorella thermoacetica]
MIIFFTGNVPENSKMEVEALKAVVKEKKGVGNIVYREVSEPVPGVGEIKVEVQAAGICGTDIHIYHDRFRYNPPVVLGHEFSGVVVEVGEGVKNFQIGDRVTAEAPARICGSCVYCRTGDYNLCSNRLGLGWGVNGCFAKYCVVEEKMAHKIPGNVSFKAGALCEPLACVIHGIELTGIRAGDVVVVAGPGPIGLLTLQAAKAEGARVIITGTSVDGERLQMAEQLGADYIINIEEKDLLNEVKSLTRGYGADVVLECSGNQASVNTCFEVIKKGGKYTQVGLFGKPITLDFEKVATKELKVTGVQSQKWTAWERALKLLEAGKIKLEPLVTGEYSMADWEAAFKAFESKQGLKTVMYPEP